MWRRMLLCSILVAFGVACGPVRTPQPTPTPTLTPSPNPTVTATSTATPLPTSTVGPQVAIIEGLVMMDGEQLIVGVNWLSKARITYVVTGGDVAVMKRYLGETARVSGQVVDKVPGLKELAVRTAEASGSAERLSLRRGYIKELGVSIYMQGSHTLVDREGKLICLLGSKEGGPDLNQFMRDQVVVIGVLSKTVEGDAKIMDVKLVEPGG
jgi:hypothetical protein